MKILLLFVILFYNTVLQANENKTTNVDTKIINTAVVKAQLQHLDISLKEYLLSETLRTQYLGFISPDISIIEVLGIGAKTQANRDKYAHKFAKIMRQTTAKVLAFQKSVNQANKSLYGNDSMFDYVPKTFSTIKRISKLINIGNCHKTCSDNIKSLINSALITPVDFYFKNETNADITTWARQMDINVKLVKNRHITLNHYNK